MFDKIINWLRDQIKESIRIEIEHKKEKEPINVLITSGNTSIPIDKVRVITNIFKGRTGALIAKWWRKRVVNVTLLTSNVDLARKIIGNKRNVEIIKYTTYNDLLTQMHELISTRDYDVVIHSSAVSDYDFDGAFIFEDGVMTPIDTTSKMSSSYPVVYFRMVQTQKIIDLIKSEWNFQGVLAKFKLQVDISDDQLIQIATKSVHDSNADVIVGNCLETHNEYAYIITAEDDAALKVDRPDLPEELFNTIMDIMGKNNNEAE